MVNVQRITTERLQGWGKKLIAGHATPAFLLGIGHDNKEGQIVLCVTEDRTDQEIIAFLEVALEALKAQ